MTNTTFSSLCMSVKMSVITNQT